MAQNTIGSNRRPRALLFQCQYLSSSRIQKWKTYFYLYSRETIIQFVSEIVCTLMLMSINSFRYGMGNMMSVHILFLYLEWRCVDCQFEKRNTGLRTLLPNQKVFRLENQTCPKKPHTHRTITEDTVKSISLSNDKYVN